jgi:hypothetical protein
MDTTKEILLRNKFLQGAVMLAVVLSKWWLLAARPAAHNFREVAWSTQLRVQSPSNWTRTAKTVTTLQSKIYGSQMTSYVSSCTIVGFALEPSFTGRTLGFIRLWILSQGIKARMQEFVWNR